MWPAITVKKTGAPMFGSSGKGFSAKTTTGTEPDSLD